MEQKFQYNDGGRAAAGFKGDARDCVARSIAIITGKPYKEVYDELNALAPREKITKKRKTKSTARDGVRNATARKYCESLGLKWVPTMQIGQGCKVHLKAEELPMGRLIARVSKHYVAVIDGVIQDTHNPARDGTRCVYGYYILEEKDKESLKKIGLNMVSVFKMECGLCSDFEEIEEATEEEAKDFFYKAGYRYKNLENNQVVGIFCPECLKDEI